MMSWTKITAISLVLSLYNTKAFIPPTAYPKYQSLPSYQSRKISGHKCFALTERQLQFWEDVDDGLNDVETVYAERGFDIDRIRAFAQSSQGKSPPPTGYAIKHQPSEEHVEGLTAKPYWDSQNFSWALKLEENSHIIIQEFQKSLDDAQNGLFEGDSVWQNSVMGTGWSAFRLQRLGEWNVENCQVFPKTYELLRSLNIPFAVRGVCFAKQSPGSGVQPHSDGRNFILTSHLGLKIPEGCWINVGDETRSWEEGKLVTIDTSFEHSTGNPTKSDRFVLIVDFWHPDLNEAEIAALTYIYDLRNKFETGKVPFRKPRVDTNEEEEGQGLEGIFKSLFRSEKN